MLSPALSRRAFLRHGFLCLGAAHATTLLAADPAARPKFTVGLLTDVHYADKPAGRSRFYQESLEKLREAVAVFNEQSPAFVVELGDLIDQAETPAQEIEWLEEIEAVYAGVRAPRHYVFGNHCVGTLTKTEFRTHTGANRSPHYSFTHEGVTFIVLDSCFRSDGMPYERKNFDWTDANIPETQLTWLREELMRAPGSVVVLAHQRLDEDGKHTVRNAPAVRALLEGSGKVQAVFQGHSHKNDYQQLAGIHYCTLVAMIEGSGPDNSGYGFLDFMADGSLRLRGYRQQANRDFSA